MRQRVVGLRRGLKLTTDRVVTRGKIAMAQHGGSTQGTGLCLREKRDLFTISARPRRYDILY